jgi:hypothetical protein
MALSLCLLITKKLFIMRGRSHTLFVDLYDFYVSVDMFYLASTNLGEESQ